MEEMNRGKKKGEKEEEKKRFGNTMKENLRRFSWEKCAKEIGKILQEKV